MLGVRHGDWNVMYENDGAPFGGWAGDNGDRWRSASMSLSYKDFTAGFKIFTGERLWKKEPEMGETKGFFGRLFSPVPIGEDGGLGANLPYGSANEIGHPHRMGAAFFSYRGYSAGIDSYRYIGHPIQNIGAHHYARPQRGFISYTNSINNYFQYKTPNIFSIW